MGIEACTNAIAQYLGRELQFDKDKTEVVAYGMFILIHTLISIGLVVIGGLICGVLVESLIVSFTIAILRKPSGGAHASRPGICAFVGMLIAVGFAKIIVSLEISSVAVAIGVGFVVAIWGYYLINKLAPVDSAAKPIRKEQKRQSLKRKSILILSVYFGIVAINLIVYQVKGSINLLNYTFCIYAGSVWQVFTLTKSGHLTVNKIDDFFKNITSKLKGVES
ncbi:MAG: accessory gene regulator ArgB-like protein [Cellulosilyticaceae bacterium]